MGLEPAGANAEQIEQWNGEIARNWTAMQETMDALLAPLTGQLLAAARVAPGERVLDLGCGCGDTVLQLAASGALVTGVDVSEPMLERARERSAGMEGVVLVLADAALYPFEPVYDVLFSRFGAMFFAEPVTAYANLRRALRPGGRVCLLCWQAPEHNPWLTVPAQAAQALLPPQEPVDLRAPGPFAFSRPEWVTEVLERAGFRDVALEPVKHAMSLGRDLDEAMQLVPRIGPVSRILREQPELEQPVRAAVRRALEPYARSGAVELGAACWLVRALT
jgi:ubiquinone/menaquinone biosynthesis C-methylase UbiE